MPDAPPMADGRDQPASAPPAAPVQTPAPRRRSAGWVPNQHGAWAMLATPLLVGIIASTPRLVHLPITATWFLGYFAFFAMSVWLKSRRLPRHLPPVQTYAAATAVAGTVVLVLRADLARWLPLFAVPALVGGIAAARRSERHLVSGIATTVGSCLMAVVAYDAGDGTNWHRAWLLMLALTGYFVGTVFYVKTNIRERGSLPHLALSVGWHASCAITAVVVSPWLALVFALLTVRAGLIPRRHLSPKQIGIGEIAATTAVAVTALLTLH